MEASPDKKKDSTALYIIYAAAAYFGIQFLFKPKRAAAAATVSKSPATGAPASGSATAPELMPAATVPVSVPVSWKAESFPLRKGMKGAKIKAMQQRLGVAADGAFGKDTETALLLQYGVSTVSQAQYQTIIGDQATKPAPAAASATGTWTTESFPLRKGMKGNKVRALQQKLGISADGAFGANTEAALQQKFGVTTVTQALFQSITQPAASSFSNLVSKIIAKPAVDNSPVLKGGSKGMDVYRLQKWLGFKDKQVARKGDPVADSIFGGQTLVALQMRTGQTSISVNRLNALMKQVAGMGYAGEVLVTKRATTILDGNLLPHRNVPAYTVLGTRMMELRDPKDQKAYTQFKTVDGFHRWVDKDAV